MIAALVIVGDNRKGATGQAIGQLSISTVSSYAASIHGKVPWNDKISISDVMCPLVGSRLQKHYWILILPTELTERLLPGGRSSVALLPSLD